MFVYNSLIYIWGDFQNNNLIYILLLYKFCSWGLFKNSILIDAFLLNAYLMNAFFVVFPKEELLKAFPLTTLPNTKLYNLKSKQGFIYPKNQKDYLYF